jgi:hypothetical protein
VAEVFRVTDKCGDAVVLTDEDIARISAKRGDDIAKYVGEIAGTLVDPTAVYEGAYADSKVFYGKGKLPEDSPFRGCYVAVIVRYSSEPASVRTVYFPSRMSGQLGTLCYLDPKAGR